MSKFKLILISFVITTFINSCSSSDTKHIPNNWIANFEIEGMVCEHGCKGVIEKEMNKVKGITAFDIDFENATAEVFFDNSTITSKEIINQVEAINDGIYKLTLVKEYKQMNAKESLPSTSKNSVSVVSNFNFQFPLGIIR